MKKRVADIIMEYLSQKGISDCFAVVGGGAMFLNNALYRQKEINTYFQHHEQACAMSAEAYARYSGKMAAVCVTSGPGATNAVTGVMGAYEDSLPIIVLSGQVRYEVSVAKTGLDLRYRGIQEFDIVNSVKNMTKYVTMLTDPLAVIQVLDHAINLAMDGRRGPVWIDIPQDIQSAMVEEEDIYPIIEFKSQLPLCDPNEIQQIFEWIKAGKRPCVLAGSGIRSANVMDEFLEFLEQIKIPVLGGAWICDNLYDEHPRYFGLSGNIGPRTGNFILQNADVILVLGNSLGFRQTGFYQEGFAPNAKIIMIDAHEPESQKPGLRIHHFLHGDLRDFFKMAKENGSYMEANPEWFSYCNHLKSRFSPFEAVEDLEMSDRVCSYHFWKMVRELEPDDSIWALGNNTGISSKLQIGVKEKKQRVIANYNCGSMGYDLPAAIGACIAAEKRVICATGDGSIMMNLQELQTMYHYDLPIHVVVFSNEGYGAIRQTCKNFFQEEYIGCTKETGVSFPDFEKVAETFQMEYRCCNNNTDVREEVRNLYESSTKRILLEIKQRLDDPITPKVMSRMSEDNQLLSPALHDMAPFLSMEELESLLFD